MIIVASLAVAVVLYTYLGFPIVIGLLARVAPARASARDPAFAPKVSALIAVHNAAAYLPGKIESLRALDWPADKLEILVYSDGSTDETNAIVERMAASDPRIKLIDGGERAGKPTAINRMLPHATGDVLLMTDVRQPLERSCLRELVAPLSSMDIACVSGNLVLPTTAGAGVYWRYEQWLRNNEAAYRSMLSVLGALYVIRKVDLKELPADTILDDMWIALRLRLEKRRLLFSAGAIAYDEVFDDDREFGRKVRTIAGQYQLLARMPGLLSPLSNPSWFEFMSHKIMRLVCPWALVVLFVMLPLTALTHDPFHVFAVAATGQLAFYLLALLGSRGSKLGVVARTFVVLNAAAIVGLWRAASGTQHIKW